MLKENSLKVLEYVKAHEAEGITAADIAEGTGLGVRQVNGVATSAFCKKGLMERIPAEIETEEGHKPIKLIRLTDAGKAFDPNAVEEKAE